MLIKHENETQENLCEPQNKIREQALLFGEAIVLVQFNKKIKKNLNKKRSNGTKKKNKIRNPRKRIPSEREKWQVHIIIVYECFI